MTTTLEEHHIAAIAHEKARVKRKLFSAIILLAIVYVAAILLYHALEGWSWEDSVFFTTSTITTVGYGDIVPHSYYGRLITIPLMLVGIAVGLYAVYAIQDYGKANIGGVANEVGKPFGLVEKGRRHIHERVKYHAGRLSSKKR